MTHFRAWTLATIVMGFACRADLTDHHACEEDSHCAPGRFCVAGQCADHRPNDAAARSVATVDARAEAVDAAIAPATDGIAVDGWVLEDGIPEHGNDADADSPQHVASGLEDVGPKTGDFPPDVGVEVGLPEIELRVDGAPMDSQDAVPDGPLDGSIDNPPDDAPDSNPLLPPVVSPLGCFKDNGIGEGLDGRDLNGFFLKSLGMTGAVCRAECRIRGFSYAGTQFSAECYCGNQYGQFGKATSCDLFCSGDLREICGGHWANTVYSTQSPFPLAPTTTITSPVDGATFTAPASITISAFADSVHSVSKVEFYQGTTLVGTATSAPYGVTWTDVAAGTYSLTTKVYDDGNTTGTSGVVQVTVTSPGGSTGADSSWINLGSSLPIESIAVGTDIYGDQLYPCRVPYGSGSTRSVLPGKTQSGWSGFCSFAWEGSERSLPGGQVLVSVWESASGGSIPKNAISFGRESNGAALYHCRAIYDQGLQPGKVGQGFSGCCIPYDGNEISVFSYQVFVDPDSIGYATVAVSGALPTQVLRAGTDDDGQPLYLCVASYQGNDIPGKTRSDWNDCHVGSGGSEQVVSSYRVIIPKFSASPGSSRYPAGNDSDGTSLGLCTASYNKSTQVGMYRSNTCHIGYRGSDLSVTTDVQVLMTM